MFGLRAGGIGFWCRFVRREQEGGREADQGDERQDDHGDPVGPLGVGQARDLNHAIQLMSNHPSTRMGGTWEVRPADESMNNLIQERLA